MVSVKKYEPGDAVRDRKLGFESVVVGTDDRGALHVGRNGVNVCISAWNVEPIVKQSTKFNEA